ncbi:MAG: hypothetical protein KIT34_10460 [Cyanobacteria bacterium TGS_CYA1]|nr:hypothetical protein [Cyanobacteria bacterium TGS_CYA1]
MRRLKATAISTAMTFLWAVQAFAAEPKTEKIQVALDIPPNPFLDQLCVVANYLTIGAIVCSFVFGGIWLMQKKDASEEDEDDDDDEIEVTPIASPPKQIETSPAEPARIESKTDVEAAPEIIVEVEEAKAEEPIVEDPIVEEPKLEEPIVEDTKVEDKKEEEAPTATKDAKAEKSGTAKKTRKSKKKE